MRNFTFLKLTLLVGFSVAWVCAGATEKMLVGKLTHTILKQLPNRARVQLENIYLFDSAPNSASVSFVTPSPPLGLTNFELVWGEGGQMRRTSGTVVVRAYLPVAVAKMPIRHGESLSRNNISFEERELGSYLNTGYYVDWDKLKSLTANGFIRPGLVIGTVNTQLPKLIMRGQSVELVRIQGLLKVTAKVKALEDGHLSDWIQVENPSSKKILQARVTGAGELQLP